MAEAQDGNLIDRAYRRFSERHAERLFDALHASKADEMKPKFTRAIALSFVVAAFVHFLTLALFAGGIFLVWYFWFNLLTLFIGGSMCVSAWAIAPSLGRKPDYVLSRTEAPNLYALADSVAASMDTPNIDMIAASPDVNASFGRFGWKRRSVLTIGLPLWLSLSPAGKIALVAHEMAHQANNDVARGFWVGHALAALSEWEEFLNQPIEDEAPLMEVVTRFVMYLLSFPISALGWLLMHLFWTESQRAEYLADHLGSRVSGTDAFLSLNNRLTEISSHDKALFDATLATPSRNPNYAKIFDRFIGNIVDVSQDEVARHIERTGGERHAIDSTHPPTLFRTKMLEAFPCAAKIELDEKIARRTDDEVLTHANALGLSLARRWEYFFN